MTTAAGRSPRQSPPPCRLPRGRPPRRWLPPPRSTLGRWQGWLGSPGRDLGPPPDHPARRPSGPPVLQAVYSQFDWTGSAHFLAGVSVFDLFIPDAAAEFEGQIEGTVDPALAGPLLSDDGVLRPGDTGVSVTQLKQ